MRYSRQEILIGRKGQKALRKALVTVVGCGGTGSIAAEHLARAGVNLRLIDRDVVELSNIQRQAYSEDDVGKPKASALRARLESINGEIRIDAIDDEINSSNVEKYLHGSTLVLDGTDNMPTRFLVNDWCMKNRLPFTYGAAVKSEGLFTILVPKKTACLQCFIPLTSAGRLDTCETAGVIGPVVGMIGSVSAAEVINFLAGRRTVAGNLLHMNIDKNTFQTITLNPRKGCESCSGRYNFLDIEPADITRLCGNAFQYRFGGDVNLHIIAGVIHKTGEFAVLSKGSNFVKLKHKDYVISLFRNRMIVHNVYSERAVRTIASKLAG